MLGTFQNAEYHHVHEKSSKFTLWIRLRYSFQLVRKNTLCPLYCLKKMKKNTYVYNSKITKALVKAF